MLAWPQKIIRFHAFNAVMITMVSLVIFVFGLRWPSWTVALGPLCGWFFFRIGTRRFRQRIRLLQNPFPESWRGTLEKSVSFYRKLDEKSKIRFENDVRIFIAEQQIYGLRGESVSDEIKVLIASSAAMLSHGLPEWEWPTVRDILVYPAGFDENYIINTQATIAGIVHQQGPIIFSEKDLKFGFLKSHDGMNVGLHELAHVLDMAEGSANGIPAGLGWVSTAPWIKIISDRLQTMQKGNCKNILNAYAGVNAAEFFAVAVEAFFEQPVKLKAHDQELYDLLSAYFHLDMDETSVKLIM